MPTTATAVQTSNGARPLTMHSNPWQTNMRAHALSFAACAALMMASCTTSDPSMPTDGTRITTQSGVLIGAESDGVRSFKGVPYAQPPVDALRWAPPQPMTWQGERAARKFALPCLQPTNADGRPNGAGVVGSSSEDCLYLNIWTPAKATKAPVMLWLYGGGGTMGGGHVPTYDGTAFARDGIVLITINYRLGALGGFAHPALTKATKPGDGFSNYHLLDAIAALRWAKANATVLGGDPENITLFGESAGATMVANLLTTPMAKGLYNKAIIESTGSLPTPATPLDRAESLGAEAATQLGLPGADATTEQLRAIPAETIILNRKTGGGLRTILDGTVKQQSIIDSFAAGTAIDVPTIIGTNSDEGRLSGTQRIATYAMTDAPVWQYFFDYVPAVRRADNPNGAPHAAELPFVFDTLGTDRRTAGNVTEEDQKVADYIHSCWVAFVKAPQTATTITCADGFRWPARTDANDKTVAIFQATPLLGYAKDLRSPPNGAPPGPTSRDEE